MEGQISKIRTMSRDLKRASQTKNVEPSRKAEFAQKDKAPEMPPEKLEKRPLPPPPPPPVRREKPRTEAKPDLAEKEAEKEGEEEEERRKPRLADILRTARERIETGERTRIKDSFRPKREAKPSLKKDADNLLPIEDTTETSGPPAQKQTPPPTRATPPANLPTEKTPPTEEISQQKPRGEKPAPGQTPEEILGIPAKKEPPSPRAAEPTEAVEAKPEMPEPHKEKPRVPEKKPPEQKPDAMFPKKEGGGIGKVSKRLPALKFASIITVLSIVIVALFLGTYWTFFLEKPQEEPGEQMQQPETAKPTRQSKPEPLIDYDTEHILAIEELSYETLKSELDNLRAASNAPLSLSYIPIEYTTEKEIRYLTLRELFNTLEIQTPSALINKDFTLFLYEQGLEAKEICLSSGIVYESCYGPRLGLVIKIDDKQNASATMREWEKTIVNDFNSLLLSKYQRAPDAIFKSGLYKEKGLETRYINLPLPTTSIDWILTDERLIIATSKDAARAVADKLIENSSNSPNF